MTILEWIFLGIAMVEALVLIKLGAAFVNLREEYWRLSVKYAETAPSRFIQSMALTFCDVMLEAKAKEKQQGVNG